jgi:hypothetical protein
LLPRQQNSVKRAFGVPNRARWRCSLLLSVRRVGVGQRHKNVPADSQPEAPQVQSVPMPLLVQAKHSGYVTVCVGN